MRQAKEQNIMPYAQGKERSQQKCHEGAQI